MSFTWLTLAGLGVLWLAVKGTASEMFQEEVKTRLAHLPNALIRLAATRLPKEVRDDYAAEWRGELASVLSDTGGLPLTRLLRGTRYAMGLFWSAGSVARELAKEGAEEGRATSIGTPARDVFSDLAISHTGSVGYRGPTACVAAGITYRQLDYWARTGLIEPSIRSSSESGSSRLYSDWDILTLAVVKRLLDTGISMMQIRTAINHLRSREILDLSRLTLMSDGNSVYACVSPDEVLDLLQRDQGVFGITPIRLWPQIGRVLSELPAVDPTSGLIRPISPHDLPEGEDFPS